MDKCAYFRDEPLTPRAGHFACQAGKVPPLVVERWHGSADAGGSGSSGLLVFSSGSANAGNSGYVLVGSGSATAGRGGAVCLSIGSGTSGSGGIVQVHSGRLTASSGGSIAISSGEGTQTSSGSVRVASANGGNRSSGNSRLVPERALWGIQELSLLEVAQVHLDAVAHYKRGPWHKWLWR